MAEGSRLGVTSVGRAGLEIALHGVRLALVTDYRPLLAFGREYLGPLLVTHRAEPEVTVSFRFDADPLPPATSATGLRRAGRRLWLDDGRVYQPELLGFPGLALLTRRRGNRWTVRATYRPPSRLARWHHRLRGPDPRLVATLLYYLAYFPLLAYLEAHRGWTPLHAAGVALPEGGLLIAGLPGCGKTTLALAFAARPGARLLSDNLVLTDGRQLYACPEPIHLDDGLRPLLPDLADLLVAEERTVTHGRRDYRPRPHRQAAATPPRWLLFPLFADEVRLAPLSPEAALDRLLTIGEQTKELAAYTAQRAVWGLLDDAPGWAGRVRERLTDLVERLACYELHLPPGRPLPPLTAEVLTALTAVPASSGPGTPATSPQAPLAAGQAPNRPAERGKPPSGAASQPAGLSSLSPDLPGPGQAGQTPPAFDARTLDPRALEALEALAAQPFLACPPVALPDLHLKPRLEAPSSLATATREHLVLGLTSPSPGCGMALAVTPLGEADLSAERLDRLFAHLGAVLDPDRSSPAIGEEALDAVLLRGAAAWAERLGRSEALLKAIEGGGAAFAPEEVEAHGPAILATVPAAFRPVARREFGLVGRGNHFLEVQVVEAVLDPATAAAWGLAVGQVVVLFHADSGHLGAIVGRLFAHRRKNSRRGRLIEWQIKLPYHLRGLRSPGAAWSRARYFLPRRWLPIPADSEEGRRCRWALGAATNYAFANRLAVLAALEQALQAVWGERVGPLRLLYDAPHNGIARERIGGQDLWVHRHNAVRVTPPSRLPPDSPYRATGHPVLLPGTHRTASFLCAGDEGAAHTLHSAGHGAGETALALGRPLEAPDRRTRLYRYRRGLVEESPPLSDEGVEAVVQTLHRWGICRPVVRLRPVATLKG